MDTINPCQVMNLFYVMFINDFSRYKQNLFLAIQLIMYFIEGYGLRYKLKLFSIKSVLLKHGQSSFVLSKSV